MRFDLHDLYKTSPRVFIAVAAVLATGFVLLIVEATGGNGHVGSRSAQARRRSTVTATTPTASTSTTASGVTTPDPSYRPTYQSVPQTPALQQIETNLGGLPAQSVAAAEALSPPAPAWTTAYPAIPASVHNDASGYAVAFAEELLDRNYRQQTRVELLAWSEAEAAAELLPGIPTVVAPKGLYVSLTEPSLADLTASPVPTAAGWSADTRAGITQTVYSVLAGPDAQWGVLVSKGFQSEDPLMTMYDVTGVLTTREGASSRSRHFTLVLGLGSALHHPGFGAFSIAEWGAQPVSCVNWNPIHDAGCGVQAIVGGVATSVFDNVAQDFAHLAEHATQWVWAQLDTATAVRLAGASWDGVLQVTVELGVLVCVTMFLLQIIFSALRQEPGGMGRAVRGVMIAMIGMFAAFIITDSLLALVDSLSNGVMQTLAGTSSWNALGSKVVNASTLTSGVIGSAGMLVGALIMLISSIVVWLALMVRKMLVIIGAAFAPIAFGGAPFDVTSAWVRRWIEFTIAMVFSKLILVILFGIGLQIELGLGQVGSATTQQITQMATGLLVMSVAGFAPWLALQFVHWAGGSMQQAGQHARSAGAGAQQAIAVPQRMYAGGRVLGAGAAAGAGGLAVAAGRLAGGGSHGNGNGGSSSGGSNGSAGGADAGDKASSAATSRAGTAGAATQTAYEAGKNQTGQALGFEGGAAPGSQERQQGGGQQRGANSTVRGEQGSDSSGLGSSHPGGSPAGPGQGGQPEADHTRRGAGGNGGPGKPSSGGLGGEPAGPGVGDVGA